MSGVERVDRSIQGLPQGEGVRPVIGQTQAGIVREPHIPLIGASTSNEKPKHPGTRVQPPAGRSVAGKGAVNVPIGDVHRFAVADRPTAPAPPTDITAEPFPTDPREQRANILLSTNLSSKTLTTLLLPSDGSMISKGDLGAVFATAFKGTGIMSDHNLARQASLYCEETLVPHGLVAREFTSVTGATPKVVGFGLTDAGQHLGVPASAIALDYEIQTEQSMYPQLGGIQSHSPDGARAPVQRASVLDVLANTSGPMSFTDIMDRTGMTTRNVGASIQALATQKLVKYDADSGRIGKKGREYSLGDVSLADVAATARDQTFATQVVVAISALNERAEPITKEAVFQMLPQNVREAGSESARDKIGRFFKRFVACDALRNNDRANVPESNLTITDTGKRLVDGYINKIDLLIADDAKTHSEAATIAKKMRRDPVTYARRVGELYYPHSRVRQSQLREQKLHEITGAISSHTDWVPVRSFLTDQVDMNPGTLDHYVDTLQRRGVVEVSVIRGAKVVRLKEAPQNEEQKGL